MSCRVICHCIFLPAASAFAHTLSCNVLNGALVNRRFIAVSEPVAGHIQPLTGQPSATTGDAKQGASESCWPHKPLTVSARSSRTAHLRENTLSVSDRLAGQCVGACAWVWVWVFVTVFVFASVSVSLTLCPCPCL